MIAGSESSWNPGWIKIGAPVSCWAYADALSTFSVFGFVGQKLPISPMTPDLIPVSPTPTVTSRMI